MIHKKDKLLELIAILRMTNSTYFEFVRGTGRRPSKPNKTTKGACFKSN